MDEPIRVLHVDDEPEFASLSAEFLSQEIEELTVDIATSAQDGLEQLRAARFDCVVSDYDMPDVDGIEFLEQVRELDAELPFILFTGKGSEQIASDAISAGVTDYLQKSGDRSQYAVLANRISNVVDTYRASRALERLHEASTQLYTAESVSDCHDIAIEAAVAILGFDWCGLAAPMPDSDHFEVKAVSDAGPLEVGEVSFKTDRGILGEVFQTKEPNIIADAQSAAEADPAYENIRAALTVPVGDWGIFQAISTEPDAFDTHDLQHAELLITSMLSAIELIEYRSELERQRNQLDSFTSVVSHDLRVPLTVAQGHLDLANETGDEEHLEEAIVSLDRMETLIDDLLALAREGARLGETEPVDLSRLVDEAWEGVKSADATLSVATDRILNADRTRLRQLLVNLLGNAVEHGGESVAVEVGDLDDGFYVEDNGPGIDPEHRDTVFDSGMSTAAQGSGLGLTIVREIANAHGWSILVTDGGRGGARFEITGVGS